MEALKNLKQHTDDKDMLEYLDETIKKVEKLPQQIEEKRLLKKRARDNFKKKGNK